MTTYLIHQALTVETGHPIHGTIDLEFKAGKRIPKSEQEEAALLLLVTMGRAEVVNSKNKSLKNKSLNASNAVTSVFVSPDEASDPEPIPPIPTPSPPPVPIPDPDQGDS